MRRGSDVAMVVLGLAAVVTSAFFLATDQPDLEDLATGLLPLVLVVAGLAAVVLGTVQRRGR